ncbi:hypothetical protein L1887_32468 [Cichorium endivia]|nr:hypothetical protein L1887_32468 [Cichorium endivia]
MSKSDSKTPTSLESSPQSEEVEERNPNPSLILLRSDDDSYDDLSKKTVEKSILSACSNVNSNANPSFSSDSEVIIADVKKNTKKTKEIMGAQSNVEDTEKKEESIESIETEGFLVINPMENSDNVVLRKLLRGPRYFDPQDNNYGNCYNCGQNGHTVASCTTAKRKKPCFVCGNLDHNAKKCKQGKICFMCKKIGHRAKKCPEKGVQKPKLCLKCGDFGHEIFTCKNVYSPDDLKEVQCYICKCFGHLCCVDYGKSQSEVSCYKCGQLGHSGLECVNSHAHIETSNTISPSTCYKCGVEGHKARKCPTSIKKRKRKTKFSHNLQENRDHIGVRSAPHGVGEGQKRNKTQNGHASSYQSTHRGGWVNEDRHVNNLGSPSTPPTYQSNNNFHGKYGANSYGYNFPYEASGSNNHGFSRSRFGDSGNYGRREYNWDN